MKIGKSVKHHVNMGNYENVEFSAWAEVELPNVLPMQEDYDGLDKVIDNALQPEIEQACEHSRERVTYIEYWKVEE